MLLCRAEHRYRSFGFRDLGLRAWRVCQVEEFVRGTDEGRITLSSDIVARLISISELTHNRGSDDIVDREGRAGPLLPSTLNPKIPLPVTASASRGPD